MLPALASCVGCQAHSFSRRGFLQIVTAISGATVLNGCGGGAKEEASTKSSPASAEPTLRIGYLPITDAAPLLVGHAKGFFEQEGIAVDKPVLMRGWPELAEGFLSGQFNFVHMLLPIPIYMRFAQNHDVKVVAWNHMNGSALTVGAGSGIVKLEDLGGKHIAVPHWYSMHNVILQLCLRTVGYDVVMQDRNSPLKANETNLFVMKPPDMPTAMANKAIDGYIVAEPFNASGEVNAKGRIVRFTGDVFKNHPCCVAVMHARIIQERPDWAQKVVNGLVRAQHWALNNRDETAQLLSKDGKAYLPMPAPLVVRAMGKYDLETYGKDGTGAIRHPDWGIKRIGFQPYPYESATREIVKLLKQTRVAGDSAFLAGLDAEVVVSKLFDYNLVTRAAEKVGGLPTFEGVDPKNPFIRTEIIEV